MKDIRMMIPYKQAENIVNSLIEMGYDVVILEGCLNNNYFCEVGENNLKLGKKKLRKYLIIVEKYINEWSSGLEMLLTDSQEKYYETLNLFQSGLQECMEGI